MTAAAPSRRRLGAIDEGAIPGGFVRDVVERVTPSILMGRRDGLSRVDEFEERHVRETVAQLMARSTAIAERVAAGTLAVAGVTYHLADGRAALVDHVGDIGDRGDSRRLSATNTAVGQLTPRHAEAGRTNRRDLGLRCECAGSGTAWPATDRDLLAAQGPGPGHRGRRDRDRGRHRHCLREQQRGRQTRQCRQTQLRSKSSRARRPPAGAAAPQGRMAPPRWRRRRGRTQSRPHPPPRCSRRRCSRRAMTAPIRRWPSRA